MTGDTARTITETLCENDWVSLMVVRKPEAGVNGYVYSHETRCRGRIVAVLPYQDTAAGREYLVKSEVTPCWGFDQVLSAITGGWEDGDIEDDAVREMLEETGYAITRGELIPLGESFASKSADTVYSLFSVNLTGRVAGEAIGDGTRLESESAAVWVDAAMLATLHDPQLAVMCMRLAATYEPAGPSLTPEALQELRERFLEAVKGPSVFLPSDARAVTDAERLETAAVVLNRRYPATRPDELDHLISSLQSLARTWRRMAAQADGEAAGAEAGNA